MTPPRLIMVNGPGQGKTVERLPYGGPFLMERLKEIDVLNPPPVIESVEIEQIVYNVFRYYLWGRVIYILATGTERPTDNELWNALIRPEVYNCAERVVPPYGT